MEASAEFQVEMLLQSPIASHGMKLLFFSLDNIQIELCLIHVYRRIEVIWNLSCIASEHDDVHLLPKDEETFNFFKEILKQNDMVVIKIGSKIFL